MPYATTLRLDHAGSLAVERLWKAIDASGIAKSTAHLGYDPHITLSRHDDLDPLDAADALDQFVAGFAPIPVEITHVGSFEAPTPVVWLAPARQPSLLALHAALRKLFAGPAWHPHTEPSTWTPHITLATAIPDAPAFARVQDIVATAFEPFETILDRVDLVRFPPVQILETAPLTGSHGPGRTAH
jgi:2'-5' RNA ligase